MTYNWKRFERKIFLYFCSSLFLTIVVYFFLNCCQPLKCTSLIVSETDWFHSTSTYVFVRKWYFSACLTACQAIVGLKVNVRDAMRCAHVTTFLHLPKCNTQSKFTMSFQTIAADVYCYIVWIAWIVWHIKLLTLALAKLQNSNFFISTTRKLIPRGAFMSVWMAPNGMQLHANVYVMMRLRMYDKHAKQQMVFHCFNLIWNKRHF